MSKKQFNTRIPEPLKRATSTVAAALDWSKEDITEVALASLLGSTDKLILAKKEKIEEKAKELALSFERANGQPVGNLIAA